MQPEPDRLVRPLRIVRCPAAHPGALVIDAIDRAIGSEDERIATTCGDRREPSEVVTCSIAFGLGSR